MILVTGSAFSSSHGLLAPRPSCSMPWGYARKTNSPCPRTRAWCRSAPTPSGPASRARARPARRTRRRAGAPRARTRPASASFRSPARACQRPRRCASHEASVNFASGPPAFLATASRMSPAARVLNTGSMTGCIRLRTPARGARSSHRSSAWCCGQQQVAKGGGLVEELRGRDLERHLPEPLGEARRLGQRVRRVGVVHEQHRHLAAVDRRAEPGQGGDSRRRGRARRRT